MPVIYQNFVSGTITDNPLLIGATTVNGSALADMVAVSGSNSMWLVLDPDGANGAPEIVSVTAHTAAATSATIARAQQSTTAREHPAGTVFRVAATKSDLDELPFRKLTTTGDMLYASAANVAARLAIGTSGLPLVAGASVPSYAALAAGGLASDSVTTIKIADGAVTYPKLTLTEVRLTKTGTCTTSEADVTGMTETVDTDALASSSVVTIATDGWYAVSHLLTGNAGIASAVEAYCHIGGAEALGLRLSVAAGGGTRRAGQVHYLTNGTAIKLRNVALSAPDAALDHTHQLNVLRLA